MPSGPSTDDIISTPALPGRRRAADIVSIALILVAAATLPFAREPGPMVPAFLPAFETTIVTIDLLTAYLLWGQFLVARRLGAALLGAAYLFSGLIAVPHLMVFPGAFAPDGLLGAGSQSASWSWIAWHGGFPVMVAAYAIVDWKGSPVLPERLVRPVLAALLLGVGALIVVRTILFTWGHDLLPQMIDEGDYLLLVTSGVGPILWIVNAAALGSVLLLLRRRTMVQLWLGVAMLAALLDVTVNLFAQQRYTIGSAIRKAMSASAAWRARSTRRSGDPPMSPPAMAARNSRSFSPIPTRPA